MSNGNPSSFMTYMLYTVLAFVSIKTYIFDDKTIANRVVHNKQFHNMLDILTLQANFEKIYFKQCVFLDKIQRWLNSSNSFKPQKYLKDFKF